MSSVSVVLVPANRWVTRQCKFQTSRAAHANPHKIRLSCLADATACAGVLLPPQHSIRVVLPEHHPRQGFDGPRASHWRTRFVLARNRLKSSWGKAFARHGERVRAARVACHLAIGTRSALCDAELKSELEQIQIGPPDDAGRRVRHTGEKPYVTGISMALADARGRTSRA